MLQFVDAPIFNRNIVLCNCKQITLLVYSKSYSPHIDYYLMLMSVSPNTLLQGVTNPGPFALLNHIHGWEVTIYWLFHYNRPFNL